MTIVFIIYIFYCICASKPVFMHKFWLTIKILLIHWSLLMILYELPIWFILINQHKGKKKKKGSGEITVNPRIVGLVNPMLVWSMIQTWGEDPPPTLSYFWGEVQFKKGYWEGRWEMGTLENQTGVFLGPFSHKLTMDHFFSQNTP